ncbi:MAG: chemotaxis protein CheW [Gammaproteobacteria bacterium]|jgi:twitching motility protein PilI|nr:chemotaxis protein CheW [Gammaproteobacteria bacterium]MDP6617158.1 chemotaxis protein CheW [Gammaproteobacteria bacterium]MDP6695367.1 chemotaxis protein CheW [Gammaproteobacteria bacterium]MDP7041532.1 chemotaxis protein CheW [Gammaproteobacteria bacterium]
MNVSNAQHLQELKDEPFELLREMERRSRAALAGGASLDVEAQEWVGIGCRLGADRLLVSRAEVREVMMMPASLTRVPGAKSWIAGLANLRGQLLPVVDLRTFLGAGTSKGERTARVLVADNPEMPVGIIVDEVFGFRRFIENEFTEKVPETELRCERYLAGACVRGADTWPVLSMSKLLDAREFQNAAA